ncbi:MAG: MFS transporter [Pseudomonadota bacterium]
MNAAAAPDPAASAEFLHGRLVLVVIGIGTLLSAMAGSAVSLALPSIGHELQISLDRSSWVMQGFLLVVTSLLLIAGRLGDLLGHRRLYLAGFTLFGLAALTCGLATSFGMLVAGRALQGVGGAMVMASSPALLTTSFPPQQRGKALGILATATYIGLTIGPPLSGLLVSTVGWRWVFFINLPVAVVILALGLRYLPGRTTRPAFELDLPGTVTLLFGLPLLLLTLSEGRAWGWSSFPTLGSAGAALVLLASFIVIERRHRTPVLDLKLFRSVSFSGAAASAMANYVALFVPIILLPFYLTEALGLDARHAGMLLSVQALVMALVASPAGSLSDRIGTRPLATAGLLLEAGGLLGMLSLDATSPVALVAVWQVVMGLGTGIFISPNSSALMGSAPRQQQGVAGGVLAVARNFGMALGVATATTLFHVAGGETGRTWGEAELRGFHTALVAAAIVAAAGAVVAFAGHKSRPHEGTRSPR